MSGLDLYSAQDAITAYITANIPWKIKTGAVPTADTLPYVDGDLDPFVVLRFSDGLPSAKDYSFTGPQTDGYYSLFDALCVGKTDKEARQLATMVNQVVLGKSLPNVGAISKQFGGGQFAVLDTARLPAAFISLTSFRFMFNITDVGSGSLVT